MGVLIDNRQSSYKLSQKKIRKKAQAILNALDNPEAELSVVIVDDSEIEALNQKYLNRSGPTNVIAFPMREGEFSDLSPLLLGDVVISTETAGREALNSGISVETRLDQLLVHGILHLFGFDHESNQNDAAKMEAKAVELLELIGDKENH
jgi:probable rRNA maturation factor